MAQREVIQFLKQNKGQKFTLKQIAKKINLEYGSTTTNMNRLIKDKTNRIKKEQELFSNKHGARAYKYWI